MEPAPTTSTSKVEFSGRSVRQQLLLAFGGTVGAFFILLVGLCAAIIFSLSELVIQESRSALTEQIVDNSKLVLGDVGLTLDAIIAQGAAALVLPLAVAVLDTSSTEVEHSLLGTLALDPRRARPKVERERDRRLGKRLEVAPAVQLIHVDLADARRPERRADGLHVDLP